MTQHTNAPAGQPGTAPSTTRAADIHTATVETLTAEVRVLVVGTRQVTLSVLGQLDTVHPSQIEPIGRVRPRDTAGEIHVIGRALEARNRDGQTARPRGTLVKSWLPTRQAWETNAHRPVCWGSHPPQDPSACMCHPEDWYHPYTARDGEPEPALIEQWAALPLLVLAGLR